MLPFGKMIALLDYGSGNLRSVYKALSKVGAQVEIISQAEDLKRAQAVVLPGVGAFGECARNLHARNLWDPVLGWLRAEKRFLGICLGYQLLFESSEESPGVAGLGIFKGSVQRFATPGLKIPQIGWNTLATKRSPLWDGLPADPFVYFVHSYFPVPQNAALVSAETSYGENFAAAISAGPIQAVQFHPEKSQATGLRILQNFVEGCASN